jgi:two-component system sensor histidine kinase DctS
MAIKETLRMTPMQNQSMHWSPSEWVLERHGLKVTLIGEAARAQAESAFVIRWLLALLGGLLVLFVSLWFRNLRLRQHTKLRLTQMEERMQSDARIATLGEMSTAIAHELNQPLGAISNYAYAAEKIAQQFASTDPALLEGLKQIRHEAQRGADVVKSIRSFIRREETVAELIDVSVMMNDLIPLLDLQAQSQGSKLSIEIEEGLRVHCSKALLQQVLLNLSRNGLEAMADIPKAARHLRIQAFMNPQTRRASFTVIDSGHGISEETRKSLFKPFFTTKKDGLGIGLSLCLSIAERQGGTVSWKNNQEGGASFALELPAEHYAKGLL